MARVTSGIPVELTKTHYITHVADTAMMTRTDAQQMSDELWDEAPNVSQKVVHRLDEVRCKRGRRSNCRHGLGERRQSRVVIRERSATRRFCLPTAGIASSREAHGDLHDESVLRVSRRGSTVKKMTGL